MKLGIGWGLIMSLMPDRWQKPNGFSIWVFMQSKEQHGCYCQTADIPVVEEHTGKILHTPLFVQYVPTLHIS